MADKPDWFKMWPSRFLQDSVVDQMTTEELGCCVRLMCRQWLDGSIPDDLDRLSRICRVDRSSMGQAWVTLCQFFPPLQEGQRANRFMFIERELVSQKMEDKSRKGLEAATKRWNDVRKNKDGLPMPNPLGNPMQDTDTDTDTEKNKNKDTSPPVTCLPSGNVKKQKPPKRIKITGLKPESVKAWEAIMDTFPKSHRVWDEVVKDWKDEPISKGAILPAQENFQAIVDAQAATPKELYATFYAYIQEEPKVAKGFVQQLATFFGPKKATWIQWIERGREMIRDQESKHE